MLAALNCCKPVVEKLIEAGANIHEIANDGMTALHYAFADVDSLRFS